MRSPALRPGPLLAIAATGLSVALSGCGGTAPSAASHAPAAAPAGRQVFLSAGCSSCHTLAAAGSTGTIGPDLDALKPSDATVIHQVIHGGGLMPSFAGRLSAGQIRAVAAFVSSASHAAGG